jgi:hypothetical protein
VYGGLDTKPIQLIGPVVGRDDLDREVRGNGGPPLGQHIAREAAAPDERDIRFADQARIVREALITAVGLQGPAESVFLAKPAETRE